MKAIRKLISLLLVSACALPFVANAKTIDHAQLEHRSYLRQGINSCCTDRSVDFLLTGRKKNMELESGSYLFGRLPGQSDNVWTFTLAEDSQVKLSFLDLGLSNKFTRLTGTKNLQLELFDGSNGNLLGAIDKNQSLTLLLAADTKYSFAVKTRSFLGGLYLGKLEISAPTPVPLSDALPMFTAALLLLGWHLRSRSRDSSMPRLACH